MSKEIWRDIPGYEGMYQASIEGNVRRLWKKAEPAVLATFIKRPPHGSAYNKIRLTGTDHRRREYKVAHIVYQTFKGNVPDGLVIMHRNGDVLDDSANNLVAVPRTECGRVCGGKSSTRKPVARLNTKREIVDIYPSVRKAAKAVGLSYQSISDYCKSDPMILGADYHYWRFDEELEY